MLRITLEWAAKLKGNALAQPLADLLADCCLRLRAHFAHFILDRVASPLQLISPCCNACTGYHDFCAHDAVNCMLNADLLSAVHTGS